MSISFFIIKLFLWIAIIYGTTQIVVESELFSGVRFKISQYSKMLGKLVNCVLCTSVWMAFAYSTILWSPSKSVYAYDVVNIDRLEHMQYELDCVYGSGSAKELMLEVTIYTKLLFYKLMFTFLDGMLSGTFIWFVHIIERRLSTFKNVS